MIPAMTPSRSRMRKVGRVVTLYRRAKLVPSPWSSVLRRRRTMLSVAFWKACDGTTSCSNLWHQPHHSAQRSTKMSWFLLFAFCCAWAKVLIHGDADAVDETARASAARMRNFFTGGPPVQASETTDEKRLFRFQGRGR